MYSENFCYGHSRVSALQSVSWGRARLKYHGFKGCDENDQKGFIYKVFVAFI